ncbi:PREDICTED: myeloma-overexpressed gene 2 protein [Colobus angolensis palliatus]|nr:PREDICTED: myeloma-overexpressed gene 2 protein [Colobus angolensis palliatus]
MGAAPRLPGPRRANAGFSELLVKGGHRPRREVCALARGTRRRSLRVECLLGLGGAEVVRGSPCACGGNNVAERLIANTRCHRNPKAHRRMGPQAFEGAQQRIQNSEGFRLPSLGCDMVFPLPWSCGSGWSMMAAGTRTSEAEQAGGSTGLLMDLAANEKAVHADFFNDFEDLFDDDDIQ